MSLSERIREQRKKAGLSQEKVAELVGVSRQAVTKWETGQSAPRTENLFKLAGVFGTTVDLLLDTRETNLLAEQIYRLYKIEAEKKMQVRLARWKQNFLCALAVLLGYVLVYLGGRIFGTRMESLSVMGWLFGTHSNQHTYVYAWLVHGSQFWMCMVVSVIPALFGKRYFGFSALGGFTVGLLAGEWFGDYPPGEPYGHGHYGWAIWGAAFVLSMVLGIVIEIRKRKEGASRSPEQEI